MGYPVWVRKDEKLEVRGFTFVQRCMSHAREFVHEELGREQLRYASSKILLCASLPAMKKKRSEASKKARNYRRRIRRLSYRVMKGDIKAEKMLKRELSNPTAKQIVNNVASKAKARKLRVKGRVIGEKKIRRDEDEDWISRITFSDGAKVPGSHIRKVDK